MNYILGLKCLPLPARPSFIGKMFEVVHEESFGSML